MAVPALRRVLGLVPLSLADWALAAGSAALPLVAKETGLLGHWDRNVTRTSLSQGETYATAHAHGT
jgi:hypothetical protein